MPDKRSTLQLSGRPVNRYFFVWTALKPFARALGPMLVTETFFCRSELATEAHLLGRRHADDRQAALLADPLAYDRALHDRPAFARARLTASARRARTRARLARLAG